MKKVCFITGSRADYGLLINLIKIIKKNKKFTSSIIATGSHLSAKHGLTYKEILKDNFTISAKVKLNIVGDKSIDINNYISRTVKDISTELKKIKPNLVILLGDRYEIFAAGIASFVHDIPICHLHGGEVTSGSKDDIYRHCLTKMSSIHFVSNIEYRKRVIQLGENPKNIFVVGGFGVDLIKNTPLLTKKKIEKNLNFKFKDKNLLVVYHPENSNKKNIIYNFNQILKCLNKLKDTQIIFTNANSDINGNIINKMINSFVKSNYQRAINFTSMGQQNYLSTLNVVDAILGNSSSGILEAPSLKIPTINVGDRQNGRLKAKSVLDVPPNSRIILKAIKKIYSRKFKNILREIKNPYDKGDASINAHNILKKINFKKIKKKKFYDLAI